MKIVSRYLISEVVASSTVTVLILWMVFFSNQLVRFLYSAVFGALTLRDVWTVMILQLPKLLTMLLPASLFLGILLAYSRLHINNEPLIMSVSGLSPRYFLAVNMALAAVLMVIVSALSLWVNPGAQRYIDILMSAASRSPLQLIEGEQFRQLPNYGLVVRVGDKATAKGFRGDGIFAVQIGDKRKNNCVVVARKAEKIYDASYPDEYLSLIDGSRYCGVPGRSDYEIVRFKRYNIRLPQQPPPPVGDESTKSMASLGRSYSTSVQAEAEFQWRCSQPILVFLLVVVATALGIATPVRGRYASFFPAIALYTFYVNFLLLSRAWLKKGVISAKVGLWWVHVVVLLCAIVLCWRNNLLGKK